MINEIDYSPETVAARKQERRAATAEKALAIMLRMMNRQQLLTHVMDDMDLSLDDVRFLFDYTGTSMDRLEG